jgi:hypothetical protein
MSIIAATIIEFKPKKDSWQRITRDWYTLRLLSDILGMSSCTGLLSCEVEGKELRGVYHIIKR